MKIFPLHDWTLERSVAIEMQRDLASQVVREDCFSAPLRTVAGVDVSCRWHSRLFHAAVVVLSYPAMQPLETCTASMETDFPYIPGLLSFRELPVILRAMEKLSQVPDRILVDGQGIAHPRGLGLASHLGLWLDLPTIGCAKSHLYGDYDQVGEQKGERAFLRDKQGAEIGTVLRTRERVKPLFISPGHRFSVETATALALACCDRYRLPEPIRAAHLASNHQRLKWETASGAISGD